ncbi:hypothetical protein AWV79_13785 [Cupriavidus sp. UYMMa02A]|nr:hypothetical protein AWV79_13785 [Cupriavidus sp. UYMMa02A]
MIERSAVRVVLLSVLTALSGGVASSVNAKARVLEEYADAPSGVVLQNVLRDQGAKRGKFDASNDGMHVEGGTIAASSLDNARSGDGTLYGYRV